MCGICGIIDFDKSLNQAKRKDWLRQMNASQIHRGPDDEGYLSNEKVSLGMRRLAIIGLKSGQQPIFNHTKDLAIFYNGELYNYRELRATLIEKGHQFYSDSDTEVVVHMYEEYGVGMLDQLRGMFAFCIYDEKKESCFLARDPFGEKPLYYHFVNNIFSFASEIPTLLKNPDIERRLNQEALPYYLRTSLVPEPLTLFKNIFTLPAGHYITIDKKGIEVRGYFNPDFHDANKISSVSEASDLIAPILERSVKRQMVAEVPLGAFLSGGIDSSSVVATMQGLSDKKIKTFNVRFEDQAYDESAIARKVAKHCNTDHHELYIPNLNFTQDIFWNIIDHIGLPFRDSSAIPTFFISKEIAKHVKVALSGDGGDELFGGYDLFQWYQKIIKLKKVPAVLRSGMQKSITLAGNIPGLNNSGLVRKVNRGLNTAFEADDDIPIALNEFFKLGKIKNLFSHNVPSLELGLLKSYPTELGIAPSLRRVMYYRLKHTLPANMLIKVDRMSMANSLEVRAPFLDVDLFNASLKLSNDLLINNGVGKYLLRKIMKDKLPAEVFNHPKQGFNLPLHHYQNETYQQLARQLLFDENPWPNLFSRDSLEEIYQNGIQSTNNQMSRFQSSHQLWMMMQLLGWAKRFNVQL